VTIAAVGSRADTAALPWGVSAASPAGSVRSPALHRHTLYEELPACVECWVVARGLGEERHLCLLDSSGGPRELGRHSILAWRPRWELRAKDGAVWAGPPGAAVPLPGPPLAALERTLAACAAAAAAGDGGQGSQGGHDGGDGAQAPPVFTGGAVGYLAYELLHELEAVPRSAAPDLGVPDCHLLWCDAAVVTDEVAARSWIVATGWGDSARESRTECRAALAAARAACARAAPPAGPRRPAPAGGAPPAGWRLRAGDLERCGVRAVTAPARYREQVRRARRHIRAGEVYELCLTQRFDADYEGCGVDLYEALRASTPAPMAAYLRYPGLEVLSCSPERFLRVTPDRWVETRPIKGTRPRGWDPRADAALAAELASAPKDGAENVMIVDLARNDLGRVCEYGTVTVPRLRAVERHPSLLQLVSTVRGRLRAGTTPVELLAATFPGGSMTGAPKVAAMRLLSAIEDSRRGVYAGAIGYVSYTGALDLSLPIRTVLKRGTELSLHTGGAVTWDSTPAAEHQEALDKAGALVWAIAAARAAGRAWPGGEGP
jgi:anthranilate/para-aminobenzoate synthase component I